MVISHVILLMYHVMKISVHSHVILDMNSLGSHPDNVYLMDYGVVSQCLVPSYNVTIQKWR